MSEENEKRETIADIVAEIRAYGAQPPPRLMWLDIADRIEASWKRQEQCYLDQIRDAVNMIGHERFVKEHPPVGNAAARDEVVLRLSKEEYKGMQEALSEHDRLCEMLSESRKSIGNAAAMREAVETALTTIRVVINGTIARTNNSVFNCRDRLKAALSAPPRQCDFGTADEQAKRFKAFCRDRQCGSCYGCPIPKKGFCTLQWAQMPYEEHEGGAK